MTFQPKSFSNLFVSVCLLGGAFLFDCHVAQAAGMELVQTPTGLSAYSPGTSAVNGSGGTSATIYGGMVATTGGVMTGACATPASNDATCNSCDGSGLKPCNTTSIHPNLVLKITLKSDTASIFTGTPLLRYKIGSSSYLTPANPLPTLSPGVPFVVNIPWRDLCSGAGVANCQGDISNQTLTVGISNDSDEDFEESVPFVVNYRFIDAADTSYASYTACPEGSTPASATQGICDFEVLPGDEKIYLQYFAPSSNGLETSHSAIKYDRLVFFYAPTFAQLNNTAGSFVLNMTNNAPSEPSLASRKITGLQNDQTYCLALGNQDQAGNISFFTPASELTSANEKKYCATPSEVVGLLDDKKCFIATATFGSDMAPEVVTFRKFRNEFLLTNTLGRAFVHNYYKYGPIAAKWITESPFLKSVSLTLLWPLLLFVKMSLALGLLPALLVLLIAAVTMQKGLVQWRRNRSQVGDA